MDYPDAGACARFYLSVTLPVFARAGRRKAPRMLSLTRDPHPVLLHRRPDHRRKRADNPSPRQGF